MPDIYFKSVPFSKEDVTLALESRRRRDHHRSRTRGGRPPLALCDVRAEADMPSVGLGPRPRKNPSPPASPGASGSYWLRGGRSSRWKICSRSPPWPESSRSRSLRWPSPSCGGGSRMRRARRGGASRSAGKPQEHRIGAEIVARHADAGQGDHYRSEDRGPRAPRLRRYADPHGAGARDAGGQLQRLHLPYARRNGAQRIWRRGLSASTRAACTPMR